MKNQFNEYGLFGQQSLVIDIGSSKTKVGLSGEKEPQRIFWNILGTLKFKQILNNNAKQSVIDPSIEQLSLYDIKELVSRGEFQEMNTFNNYIDFIKEQVNIKSQNQIGIFLTEPVFMSINKKKQILENFMEEQDVPQIFFCQQPMLSLYSLGLLNGTVIESGEGVTQLQCVFQGQKLDYVSERINLGGKDLTFLLKKLLKQQGANFVCNYDKIIYEQIKENYCRIFTNNFLQDLQNDKRQDFQETIYQLPDGKEINISPQIYQVGELFFDSKVSSGNYQSFPEIIMQQINQLDIEMKKVSLQNIILSGGNTQLQGFSEWITFELEKLIGDNNIINVVGVSQNRENMAWKGGSVISSLSSFNSLWITKSDYQEFGSNILLNKKI